jgi:surface polysaccharide O-acyltransferase-like enzyme
MVVGIHASGSFLKGWHGFGNIDFTIANLYDSLSRAAVPLFVLLSGAFVLGADKNSEAKRFYNSRLAPLVALAILWNLFYFLFGVVTHSGMPLYSILKEAKTIYHLWFLPMIAGLYIVTPLLIRLKRKVGPGRFFTFGLIMFLVSIIYTSNWAYLSFIGYLGYYILGDFLKNYYTPSPRARHCLPVLFAVSVAAIFFGVELTGSLRFYNNNFIFVMAGAPALFAFFGGLRLRPHKIVANLVKYSFDIYLVHAFVLAWLMLAVKRVECIASVFRGYGLIWAIPALILTTFVLSWALSALLHAPTRWLARTTLQPVIEWAVSLSLRMAGRAATFFGRYGR